MATIRDVAKRAKVSVATVSHVMNDSRFVKPETKARVLAAISELNYRRDGIARSLRRSRTGTIGVVISDITNPFFSDLVKGIEQTVHDLKDKINVILCNTEEDIERELVYLHVLQEKRIDGLILAPAGGNAAYLTSLADRAFPLVFVDRALDNVAADSVLVDNIESSEKMVSLLIERGHKRIAVFAAELTANSIADRVVGYWRALESAAIPKRQGMVFSSPSSIEAAHEIAREFLITGPRPDAVFCTNNFMTLGLVRALHELGLECPADVAVASFDDFPWAESFRPQIAAVAQPSFDMGREAARMLDDRMTKKTTGRAIKMVIPSKIMIRESLG